tara:strand:- start:19717 stop:20823 length:1107 start_codon:yes stop_codon:yes gene_type:complete
MSTRSLSLLVLTVMGISGCGTDPMLATHEAPMPIASHQRVSFQGEEVLRIVDPEIFGLRSEHLGEARCLVPAGGTVTSVPIREKRFQELLPSWNVHVGAGASFTVDIAVASGTSERSPWLRIGEWGAVHGDPGTTSFHGGEVAVDLFRGTQDFDRWWWRLQAHGGPARIDALHAVVTDRKGRWHPRFDHGQATGVLSEHPLAPRSQRLEDARIAGRICSPTSVAMLLEHHGVVRSTSDFAALLYDARHDIYGNWNRAIQGAYQLGVPGRLERFAVWSQVRAHLADTGPLVISIGFGSGELTGAPLDATRGHLVVLCGLDGRGGVICMDPAAATLDSVRRVYAADEIERAWMDRNGVAYAFHDPSHGGR